MSTPKSLEAKALRIAASMQRRWETGGNPGFRNAARVLTECADELARLQKENAALAAAYSALLARQAPRPPVLVNDWSYADACQVLVGEPAPKK